MSACRNSTLQPAGDPLLQSTPSLDPAASPAILSEAPSPGAPTETAFLAETPPSLQASFTPASLPAPIEIPTATLPPPAQMLHIPPEVEVVVLLGSDNFAPYIGRTDSILLLFLNANGGSASLVSIPRDLYLYLPGQGMERINTAYVSGGIELLFQALEYNLGVRPAHWVLAHLDDFIRFVDDLGGIDVQVARPLPDDCGGIAAGLAHMDGFTALCYVRERKTSDDFDRSFRQQTVLQAIFNRFLSLDSLFHLPDWYARYSGSLQTDLTFADLVRLAPLALHLYYDGGGVHQFQIGRDQVSAWEVPESGARVLVPLRERIQPMLQQAVDLVLAPVPTSSILETRIAELTATPTPELAAPEMAVPEPVPGSVGSP